MSIRNFDEENVEKNNSDQETLKNYIKELELTYQIFIGAYNFSPTRENFGSFHSIHAPIQKFSFPNGISLYFMN